MTIAADAHHTPASAQPVQRRPILYLKTEVHSS